MKLAAALIAIATPLAAQDAVSVALDWTANTNHVGLYVAQAQEWYEGAGLAVDILPYADTSAGTLVAAVVADFGIVGTVGFQTQRATGADMTVVYAVVQHETGRLVFSADRDDIQRPADLDGKIYAGFGTGWEEALIATMIQSDGGMGQFDTVTLGTSAYEALANGIVGFTLEISTWEGVNSVLLDRLQRAFRYADYGVPDQQTTLLAGNGSWLAENDDAARAFVQVTQRGYQFAADHPQQAADMLIAQTAGMLSNTALVHASMEALVAGDYLRGGGIPVGQINGKVFHEVADFLYDTGLLSDGSGQVLASRPDIGAWFTNAYLDPSVQ